MTIWDYAGRTFVNKNFHFKCDCLLSLDFVGTVVDYEKSNGELVLVISHNGKIIRLGSNHPNLTIEEVL